LVCIGGTAPLETSLELSPLRSSPGAPRSRSSFQSTFTQYAASLFKMLRQQVREREFHFAPISPVRALELDLEPAPHCVYNYAPTLSCRCSRAAAARDMPLTPGERRHAARHIRCFTAVCGVVATAFAAVVARSKQQQSDFQLPNPNNEQEPPQQQQQQPAPCGRSARPATRAAAAVQRRQPPSHPQPPSPHPSPTRQQRQQQRRVPRRQRGGCRGGDVCGVPPAGGRAVTRGARG